MIELNSNSLAPTLNAPTGFAEVTSCGSKQSSADVESYTSARQINWTHWTQIYCFRVKVVASVAVSI